MSVPQELNNSSEEISPVLTRLSRLFTKSPAFNAHKKRDFNEVIQSPNSSDQEGPPKRSTLPTNNLIELSDLLSRLSKHDERLNTLSDKCESQGLLILEFKQVIENKVNTISDLGARVKFLESGLKEAKAEIEELEMYSRRNGVRIYGIPEDANENTDEKIVNFANHHLKLPLTQAEIGRSHRVSRRDDNQPNKNNTNSPRPIICKFNSHNNKDRFISARIATRQDDVPFRERIYVNEDLTISRAILAKKARELKTQYPNLIRNSYTRDGKLIIKTADLKNHRIKNEDELTKFAHYLHSSQNGPIEPNEMINLFIPPTTSSTPIHEIHSRQTTAGRSRGSVSSRGNFNPRLPAPPRFQLNDINYNSPSMNRQYNLNHPQQHNMYDNNVRYPPTSTVPRYPTYQAPSRYPPYAAPPSYPPPPQPYMSPFPNAPNRFIDFTDNRAVSMDYTHL